MFDGVVGLQCFLLALLPISELRGAIPVAVAQGLHWGWVLPLALGGNLLVAPLAFLFLKYLHRFCYHFPPYRLVMDRIFVRVRNRVHRVVERYGFWGLLIFVAIPLPITGAWSAALGAWLLDITHRKAILAISLGVAVSAVIITSLTWLGITLRG